LIRFAFIVFTRSTLPLLVARVLANDPNHALAADHLALVTNLLNAGSNFHRGLTEKLGGLTEKLGGLTGN
jgi:hypothetical protein